MMIFDKSSIKKTHYEVLSVKEDACNDEIKRSYRAAILNSHPDKLNATKSDTSVPYHDQQERFLEVQNAWKVLSDSLSRANYDAKLRASRQGPEVLANEVKLGEMTVEMVGDVQEFLYECRCGDFLSVTSLDLKEMGVSWDGTGEAEFQKPTNSAPISVLLPCGSCSLEVHLVLDVDS